MGCCDRVSGNAPVLMMEAAAVREGGDIALVRLLGRSWFWVPLVECKMHLRCVIEKNESVSDNVSGRATPDATLLA